MASWHSSSHASSWRRSASIENLQKVPASTILYAAYESLAKEVEPCITTPPSCAKPVPRTETSVPPRIGPPIGSTAETTSFSGS